MNILITGGASGLGKAITQKLANEFQEGTIFFTYHQSYKSAEEIEHAFGNTKAVKCNFSNKQEINNLKSLIAGKAIDVLINNAISHFSKNYFHKTEIVDFNEGFEQNIIPTISITQSFLQQARKRRKGKIITILSSILDNPSIGWSKYLAEKMYLLGLSKSWAKENIQFNITSNCISPGFMQTGLQQDVDERVIEEIVSKHPLKRLLTVEEVADVVLFIVKTTSQLNGQNIIVDPV